MNPPAPAWRPTMWRRALGYTAPIVALWTVVGCGVETVVHNLEEREANKITELLAEGEINATKGMVDNGRTVTFTITVPARNKIEAIRMLNRNELPTRPDSGYAEIFRDGGLIPTAAEERAKQMAAIEGEIEKQLKLVHGILDVQVQLVIPEETALRTAQEVRSPTTASVTIKYLPAQGGAKPLSEPQVQAVVAAGVERLTPENVVVVMTPTAPIGRADRGDSDPRTPAWGGFRNLSARQTNMAAGLLIVLLILASIALAISTIRLRTVRGRLLRLQTEIGRARRRPTDAPPPPAVP